VNTPFYDAENNIMIKSGNGYVVMDKFNNDVNLYDKSTSRIYNPSSGYGGSGLSGDNENYFIYDCRVGKCLPTSGYIKIDTSYYSFTKDESATSIEADIDDESIDFENDGKTYIVLKGEREIDTPFYSEDYDIPVRHDENFIAIDKFYTSVSLVHTGTYEANNELASMTIESASDYVVVDCIDSVCKQTNGYVKTSNGMYFFNDEVKGKISLLGEIIRDQNVVEEEACTNKMLVDYSKIKRHFVLGIERVLPLLKAVKSI